ncbi:kynureninase [Sphaerisporangium krabiense]|uniref:Kynureninase n=1 Tax=Sphaerisporangium krabiense TaxID=763782 RepID=A0A7W9DN90_9ACTN|nr:kynureninase [Sphaerisporangium krabiense]MBB5624759.1 kynureninase [Sphaerisporangium krabiense]GII61280.1 kynureninase [Sphaerisporangium krabiense]
MTELNARAAKLDAEDPLGYLRAEFDLDPAVVYLDGNSLGAPPRQVAGRVEEVVREQWGRRLIRSWPERWWVAPERVGEKIAPLVGAAPGQVVVADSTSVNVFKALVGAVRLAPGRREIVVDATTFPTDGYVAESAAELTGTMVVPAVVDELDDVLSERTAVVLLNQVDYKTGRLHDMAAATEKIHAAGARAVWDLCHSVGVLPIELDALGVDVAVGCTYKFLNGGPGSPAFIYVPHHLQAEFHQPLPGWGGHRDPFAMESSYAPAPGIARARAGTPDILSLLALDAALEVWDGVDMTAVRAKGLALTGFFIECVDELLGRAVEVVTPRGEWRGHQVSLRHHDASTLVAELTARDVIGDYRPPDVLRFGFAPLYVTYGDALRAARALADLLAERG